MHSRGKQYGFKKKKIELPHDPAILLLDIYPEEMKILLQRYMHLNVHSSIIYNSQDMEATLNAHQYMNWILKM